MTQRYMAPPDLESVAVAFHTSVGTMNRDHGVEGGAAVAFERTAVVHGRRAPELDAMSREQLYAVVWATPLEQVVERYRISNVALRNRCVRPVLSGLKLKRGKDFATAWCSKREIVRISPLTRGV